MYRLSLAAFVLLISSFASATATVSGKLVNPDTSGAIPSYVQFDLENCGGNYPIVTGASVAPRQTFTLANDGTWSGVMYRNDEITCNGSPSTWWRRTYFVNSRQLGPAQDYICSQASCAFDSMTPLTVYPALPSPIPPSGSVLTAPLGPQTITGGFGLTLNGPFAASSIESVRYANEAAGVDCGAKINTADSALGATSGQIWVNQACGLTWTTAVSLSAKHTLRFIQGGTYTFTGALTLATGAGIAGPQNGPGLESLSGQVVLQQANGANLASLINLAGAQNFIWGITLDGNKANNTTSVGLTISGRRVDLQNVTVWNTPSHGIKFASTAQNNEAGAGKIDKVHVIGAGGSGMLIANTGDVFISKSEFENSTLYGLDIQGGSGLRAVQNDFGGNTSGGVRIAGTAQAFSTGLFSYGNMFTANQFGNNHGHDISIVGFDTTNATNLGAGYNQFTGNNFIGLAMGVANNTFDAFHVEDSAGNSFRDNHVIQVGGGGGTYRYGANVLVNGGHTSARNDVNDNSFRGTFGTASFTGVASVDVFNGNDDQGIQYSRFFSPFIGNNDSVFFADSGGTRRSVLQYGSDNNVYLKGDPTAKTVNIQPNPGTTRLAVTDSAVTVSGVPTNLATLTVGGGSTVNAIYAGVSGNLTFGAITQNRVEQTFTLTGASTTNFGVTCSPRSTLGNAAFSWSAYVSASNTIAIGVTNPTAGALTPNAVAWGCTVIQ